MKKKIKNVWYFYKYKTFLRFEMLRSGSIEQARGRKQEKTNSKNEETTPIRNIASTITTQSPIYTTLKVKNSSGVKLN